MARPLKTYHLSCILAVTLCLIFAVAVFISVPLYTDFFVGSETIVPTLTLALIKGRIPLAVGFSVFAIALVAKEWAFNRRSRFNLLTNLSFLAITCIMIAFTSFQIWFPLIGIIKNVE